MKSFKRLGIDPLAVYGTVFVKCPVGRHRPVRARVPRARARRAGDRAAAHRRGDGRGGARGAERARRAARRRGRRRRRARSSGSRPPATRSTCRTSTPRSTTSAPSASSGARSARSATGTRTSRRTEAAERYARPQSRGRSGMAEKARILVVANRTAESPELLEALRSAPCTGHASSRCSCPPRRTASPGRPTCTRRRRGRGAPRQGVRGRAARRGPRRASAKVGDPDPLAAVQDECNFARATTS